MALTTMSNLNDEQINFHCYLVPSLDEKEVLVTNWKQCDKMVNRTSSLEDLCRILEQDWPPGQGSLTFILFNGNQVRSPLIHKNFKPFQEQSSPSNVYLYRYSCVNNEEKNPNCCMQCCQTIKTSCISRWWPYKNQSNSINTYDLPLEQDKTKDFSSSYSSRIQRSLFVHIYITILQQDSSNQKKEKKISEIKLLGGKARSKYQRIDQIVNTYKTKTLIENLVKIIDGEEITYDRLLLDKNCSIITVIERPSNNNDWYNQYNFKSYEAAIRLYIYSIVLDKKYSSNISYFLNYCDRNKTFKLDRHELETALITMIELFRKCFNKLSKEEFHLTYYDLLIPESKSSTWEYNDCLLIFADTLVEYIRLKWLLLISSNDNDVDVKIKEAYTEFLPDFLSCLKETLNNSLKIDPKYHSKATMKMLCEKGWTYLFSLLVPPILLLGSISCCCYRMCKRKTKEHQCEIIGIQFLKTFCWVCLVISLINIGIYYWRSATSSEANELEIYWPLALTISTITILHIYEASKAYRYLSNKNNSVRKTYAEAHLTVLEAKSKPNTIEKDKNKPIHIKKFMNNDLLHSTLIKGSIAKSLTLTGSKTMYKYIVSSCTRVIIVTLIFLLLLSITISHSLIPYIHRHWPNDNETSLIIPWQIECIHISYIVYSMTFYLLLLVMMTISIGKYALILKNLKRLLSSTELMQNIDLETSYFLNLREPKNLEYFLSLFRPILRNIDQYHIYLSTMACAVIINIILILTVVIHVFIYNYSIDLLTIWCLIDIIILSIFIIIFLAIVILINNLLMHDLVQGLKNLKKIMITPSAQKENSNDTICYLDAVIENMESESKEYAVKLFGFIVDRKLVAKILISIATGIGSAIVSAIKRY